MLNNRDRVIRSSSSPFVVPPIVSPFGFHPIPKPVRPAPERLLAISRKLAAAEGAALPGGSKKPVILASGAIDDRNNHLADLVHQSGFQHRPLIVPPPWSINLRSRSAVAAWPARGARPRKRSSVKDRNARWARLTRTRNAAFINRNVSPMYLSNPSIGWGRRLDVQRIGGRDEPRIMRMNAGNLFSDPSHPRHPRFHVFLSVRRADHRNVSPMNSSTYPMT